MGNLVRPENPWTSVQCCISLAWTEATLNEIPQHVGRPTNSGAGRSAPVPQTRIFQRDPMLVVKVYCSIPTLEARGLPFTLWLGRGNSICLVSHCVPAASLCWFLHEKYHFCSHRYEVQCPLGSVCDCLLIVSTNHLAIFSELNEDKIGITTFLQVLGNSTNFCHSFKVWQWF